jgi:hypothetical protein
MKTAAPRTTAAKPIRSRSLKLEKGLFFMNRRRRAGGWSSKGFLPDVSHLRAIPGPGQGRVENLPRTRLHFGPGPVKFEKGKAPPSLFFLESNLICGTFHRNRHYFILDL